MRKENKFLTLFAAFILLLVIIFLILYFFHQFSDNDLTAFIYGFSLTTLNFIGGTLSIKIALDKENKGFLSIIFGGILVRMMLMLGAVYLGLQFLEIKTDVFIFVIFIFYSFYLIAEIFYFYLLKGRTE
jgi:hypothetical protein